MSAASPSIVKSHESTWTVQDVLEYLRRPGNASRRFITLAFRWTKEECDLVLADALAILERHNIRYGQLPAIGHKGYEKCALAETELYQKHDKLLRPPHMKHAAQYPSWYAPGMSKFDRHHAASYDYPTLGQLVLMRSVAIERQAVEREAVDDETDRRTKRKRSVSRDSAASHQSSTARIGTGMKRRRLASSNNSTMDDVEPAYSAGHPVRTPVQDEELLLSFARINQSSDEHRIEVRRTGYLSVVDHASKQLDWKRVCSAAQIVQGEAFYYFTDTGKLWVVKDEWSMSAAIIVLRRRLDAAVRVPTADLFVTLDRDELVRLPSGYRVPSKFDCEVIPLVPAPEPSSSSGVVVRSTEPEPKPEQEQGQGQGQGQGQEQEQEQEQELVPTSGTPFPFMKTFDAHSTPAATARMEPSIDLGEFRWSRVDWLSGGGASTKVVSTDRTLWRTACRFFHFDEKELHPYSSVFFPGWSPDLPLKSYQFLVATWALQSILRGYPLAVIALDMGLGKTAIGLACLYIHMLKVCRRKNKDDRFGPILEDEFEIIGGAKPLGEEQLDERLLVEPKYTARVRSGPTLIVVPNETLITQWIKEIKKFIVSERDKYIKPLIVVAYNQHWSERQRADFGGCYHWSDTVSTSDPYGASLLKEMDASKSFHEKTIKFWADQKKVPILSILEKGYASNGDFCAESWQSRYWVITTRNSLSDMVRTSQSGEKGKIDAVWGMCLIDEFHLTKAASSAPFETVGNLWNDPAIIALSGTPYTKATEIYSVICASVARFYSPSSGYKSITTLSASQFDSESLRYHPSLSHEQRPLVDEVSFKGIYNYATTLDKFVSKVKVNAKPADEQDSDDEDAEAVMENASTDAPEDVKAAYKKFGASMDRIAFVMKADRMWQPNPEVPGLPAVDMPPHSGFDINVPLDEEFEPALASHWRQALQDVDTMGKVGGVLGTVQKFRSLILFPCLYKFAEENPALKAELGGYNVGDAQRVDNRGEESIVWGYMQRLNNTNSMKLLRLMICNIRAQTNVFGQPRKVVIVCHKPFNAAIVHLYLKWLKTQPEFAHSPTLNGIAFVPSWGSNGPAAADARKALIAAFVTSKNTADGYRDNPCILLAVVSRIKTGIELPPADVVICLDGCWTAADDKQVAGRVQRNRMAQKATHTESFRFICASKNVALGTWQSQRHCSQAMIQSEVQNATKE